MRLCFLFAIGLSLLGCSASNQLTDWPNYRGPRHDNSVLSQGVDVGLDDLEQRTLWRKPIGRGYTVVAVAGGRAYTAGWTDGTTTVRCFDPETGEDIWGFDYDIHQFDQRGQWPRSNEGGPVITPAIAHGNVYHTTRDGRMFCLSARTGRLRWQKNLPELFDVPEPRWGFSASPLVVGDVIYMDLGKIVAMTPRGRVLWETEDYTQSYSSPTPFYFQGRLYLAAFPLKGPVVVDAETGEVKAFHAWQTKQPVHAVSPVVFDDDKIFVSSGWNGGGEVLRFTGEGFEVIWESKKMSNMMATSLYHDGQLYGFDQKVLRCIDAMTGEEQWAQRGLGLGTLLAVGDTMLIMTEAGELMSAPLTPEGFKPGEAIGLIDFQKVWSCPVIANGRLYAKDPLGELVCLDLIRR